MPARPVDLSGRTFGAWTVLRMCGRTPGEAIYYPGAFDAYGRKVIERNVPRLLAVNQAEAARFGCNAVVVGRTVVTNTGCEKLTGDLRERGYAPVAVELDEFLKAGGSAKCLTLRLDRRSAGGKDPDGQPTQCHAADCRTADCQQHSDR